jgi:thiosulfate dehydrogenase (quinone) large subunit
MATTLEAPNTTTAPALTGHKVGWTFLSLTRIAIGFYFLWAFFDKLLGLGRSTCSIKDEAGWIVGTDYLCAPNPETGAGGSWLKGGHVTEGYLVYGGNPHSPFNDFFVSLGAQRWTDWIFMIGLLAIGAALMLGIGTKVAMFAGPAMLLFMYMTQMWPQTNPILDDHIIMSLAVIGVVLVELGHQSIGLGKPWRKLVGEKSWLV